MRGREDWKGGRRVGGRYEKLLVFDPQNLTTMPNAIRAL